MVQKNQELIEISKPNIAQNFNFGIAHFSKLPSLGCEFWAKSNKSAYDSNASF